MADPYTGSPEYSPPAAIPSHARHYLPQFAVGKTSLVFDAFTAVDRNEPLGVVWPQLTLPADQRSSKNESAASAANAAYPNPSPLKTTPRWTSARAACAGRFTSAASEADAD